MNASKYAALEEFLRRQDLEEVPMRFAEIERIIGAKLPASAYRHRPWWSNNPANSAITHAWLNAGFKTEQVDMKERKLIFRRTTLRGRYPISESARSGVSDMPRAYAVELRHPLFGALKGTIRIAPGTDLAEPADPDWGAADE